MLPPSHTQGDGCLLVADFHKKRLWQVDAGDLIDLQNIDDAELSIFRDQVIIENLGSAFGFFSPSGLPSIVSDRGISDIAYKWVKGDYFHGFPS